MELSCHNATSLSFLNNFGGQTSHGKLAALQTSNWRMPKMKQKFQKLTAQARLGAKTIPDLEQKIMLDDEDMPHQRDNLIADLSEPASSVVNPETHEPFKTGNLIPLSPEEMTTQETSQRDVEPAAQSLTKGVYVDATGGLHYHGMMPLVSRPNNMGSVEAPAIPQNESFQGEIQGAYQIKATTTALALLLASRHSELAKVYVQGRLIKSSASGIVTRSKAKLAPDQWSLMPLPAKILSLLADMLIEIQEQNTIGVDEDDEWEDMQNSEDDGYTDVTHSVSTTSNGRPVFKNFDAMKHILNEEVQDDDYQDDPLRAADPLNGSTLHLTLLIFSRNFLKAINPYLNFFARTCQKLKNVLYRQPWHNDCFLLLWVLWRCFV